MKKIYYVYTNPTEKTIGQRKIEGAPVEGMLRLLEQAAKSIYQEEEIDEDFEYLQQMNVKLEEQQLVNAELLRICQRQRTLLDEQSGMIVEMLESIGR